MPWPRASATPSGSSAGRDGLPGTGIHGAGTHGAGTHGAGRFVQGGVMQLESLYQEIILDHYRRPHGKGLREPYDAEVHHVNPLCGDEVTLRVSVKDAGGEPTVADISYDALGCSISQASASVMTDLVVGKTVDEAMAISGEFLTLMQSKGEGAGEDAVALEGGANSPARIKCALLGWMAWKDATAQALEAAGRADALLTETGPADTGVRETA